MPGTGSTAFGNAIPITFAMVFHIPWSESMPCDEGANGWLGCAVFILFYFLLPFCRHDTQLLRVEAGAVYRKVFASILQRKFGEP